MLYSTYVDYSFLERFISRDVHTDKLGDVLSHNSDVTAITFLKKDHLLGMALSCLGMAKWVPYERTHPKFYLSEANIPFFRRPIVWAYFLASRAMSSAIILQTQSAREYWEKEIGYRKQTFVLPNIFFTFPPIDSMKKRSSCHIVMGGRLIAVKDYDLALESFAELKNRGFFFSASIFGEGPLKQHLERKISLLNISSQVRIPGYSQNFLQHLRESDLYLMTSYIEGMPNSLGEALGNGLICVSTYFPGIEDLINPSEKNGVQVVRERTPSAIASTIISIWDNEELRSNLGIMNARSISNSFSEASVSSRYIAIIGSLEHAN